MAILTHSGRCALATNTGETSVSHLRPVRLSRNSHSQLRVPAPCRMAGSDSCSARCDGGADSRTGRPRPSSPRQAPCATVGAWAAQILNQDGRAAASLSLLLTAHHFAVAGSTAIARSRRGARAHVPARHPLVARSGCSMCSIAAERSDGNRRFLKNRALDWRARSQLREQTLRRAVFDEHRWL